MTHRSSQQRPPATPEAAPAQREAQGPATAKLGAASAALNAAPAVQRLATMAPNRTGMPDNLKAGVEAMSGMSLDHVRVHRNSPKPAQLNAHAYAQGSDIHLAPGQERHLPHEAWHVVQQAQGRVKPTMQMKGDVPVNDEAHLEHEADLMGAKALAAPVQRAPMEDEEVHQAVSATAQRAEVEDDAVQQAARAPLQRAAIASFSRPVVQRAGVKAEMSAGDENFNEFIGETKDIAVKRNQVATAIYNRYKPLKAGERGHYSDGGDHKGPDFWYNQKVALNKAKRLTHWTTTAVNSAARIYAELSEVMDFNNSVNISFSDITFGIDTTVEPDVFARNDIALEVKRIDSAAQGSVDGHIKKVSEQLDEREYGPQKTKITQWVASIVIDNGENPWPYTPAALAKAQRSKTVDALDVGEARLKKYENTTRHITYRVSSRNPSIGSFEVTT